MHNETLHLPEHGLHAMYTIEHTAGLYTVRCPKGEALVSTLCPKVAADLLPTQEEFLDACDEHFMRTGQQLAFSPRGKGEYKPVAFLLPEDETVIETTIDFAKRITIAEMVRACVETVGSRGVVQELQS